MADPPMAFELVLGDAKHPAPKVIYKKEGFVLNVDRNSRSMNKHAEF